MSAVLTHSYNLGRLGNAGDTAHIEADAAQCAAIAALAGALSLSRFAADVALSKLGATRFKLDYRLAADVIQPCVVTLEPVAATVAIRFTRELHFTGPRRAAPAAAPAEVDLSDLSLSDEDEQPEEIESLHYDLAGPALEEFLLALDPYPRAPGVAFDPGPEASARPESPFAALKSLKSKT